MGKKKLLKKRLNWKIGGNKNNGKINNFFNLINNNNKTKDCLNNFQNLAIKKMQDI